LDKDSNINEKKLAIEDQLLDLNRKKSIAEDAVAQEAIDRQIRTKQSELDIGRIQLKTAIEGIDIQ